MFAGLNKSIWRQTIIHINEVKNLGDKTIINQRRPWPPISARTYSLIGEMSKKAVECLLTLFEKFVQGVTVSAQVPFQSRAYLLSLSLSAEYSYSLLPSMSMDLSYCDFAALQSCKAAEIFNVAPRHLSGMDKVRLNKAEATKQEELNR